MKARRVTIKLEVETELSLKTLCRKAWWTDGMSYCEADTSEVLQVQVNVIKKEKD